jgi:hypothetical protein
MKKVGHFIALIVIIAQITRVDSQEATNRLRVLSANALARTAQNQVNKIPGQIATNTPAFELYAYPRMLAEVNSMREKWNLPIPNPLTTNNSYITLIAGAYGINGAVSTKDGRFRWNFSDNRMIVFGDTNYYPQSFRYHDDESAKLAKVKSKINAKEAEAIARNHLHLLGLTERQLKLTDPPRVNQYKFEEADGTIYPLPVFNIAWHENGHDNPYYPGVTFDVSGITKQVVEYANLSLQLPPAPIPKNYFEMLGVKPPTNTSQRLGLRPLEPLDFNTNSASGRN